MPNLLNQLVPLGYEHILRFDSEHAIMADLLAGDIRRELRLGADFWVKMVLAAGLEFQDKSCGCLLRRQGNTG